MLTLEDCLGLCELDEEEILAIAEHEHVPEIVALEMAQYMVHLPEGTVMIKRMILEDIQHAKQNNNQSHAEVLEKALKHFIVNHPEFKAPSTQ
ncbi:hypothetical protein [Sedimenticola selenatireducens]|jgi:fructose-bisphosphate aldolase class 1|uniref:Uncharacterized protein n=1 Tax=Sedimenticola selenatireducens TaxID=191960 RepID=A0A558DXP0_9GAMM|nr:hypothetical protein [Sedimenticola selenatireducens]TVO70738.1 hypothetical protein FHP88_14835 [Sedimenticola selenatireducens]TVT65658.1 MAG: hypothetical protein FHK78_02805 [Sedimenticola selenatireducens]